jgi:hypothetical protein
MKTLIRLTLLSILIAICAGMAAATAPREHPHYLHALSNLRFARAHLDQLAANEQRDEMELRAIEEIDAAINEIKRASIDDHKDLRDHPPIDAGLIRGGRIYQAHLLLEGAHQDVAMEEDNPEAQGLQARIIMHIDKAHRITGDMLKKYHR